MNYRQARQLVRDNMEVVRLRQRKPDTFVEIRATVYGRIYKEWDTAKYNLADEKKEGVKFSASFGLHLATGRAVKRIARRVMRIQAVQIDVAITGAKIEEREGGRSYVVPELAKAEEPCPAFRFPTREELDWFGREMLGSSERAEALMRRYFSKDEINNLHAALAKVEEHVPPS